MFVFLIQALNETVLKRDDCPWQLGQIVRKEPVLIVLLGAVGSILTQRFVATLQEHAREFEAMYADVCLPRELIELEES